MKRKLLTLFVAFCLLLTQMTGLAFAADSDTPYTEAMEKTGVYITQQLSKNGAGYGSDWMILGLARSGVNLNDKIFSDYYDDVVKTVKECKGELHKRKYTEYSRTILVLSAIGKDPTNVGGYNLLEKLADFNNVKWQGINGTIWALIALDCKNYEIPKVKGVAVQSTREKLIGEILGQQLVNGGFALSGTKADSDITAMALQALAPYVSRGEVKKAVDKAVLCLSEMQNDNGTYDSWGTENAESICQTIVALTALGIDLGKDIRFVKNGKSVVDGLMLFYDVKGGFRHVNTETEGYKPVINGMATEQSFYALVAYDRFVNKKNSLYDMTDGEKPLAKPAKAAITSLKSIKSKALTVQWKKVKHADGYQITYATVSKFTGSKSVLASKSALSKTVTKLKSKKTYYVKVRAYRTDAKGNKVYGSYSAPKKVKVK
ncbi:fibronectin type III domain-containing protein [Ihubacter sp. rT4E-8]|uniref:fibronectin type III domain-containing protein n=1 Tax=Ihubacter sp. rT4E-8 TaxID=3242369 RepID=UPI003CE6EC95